jgi:branched-chain amino acid transport system permease protein
VIKKIPFSGGNKGIILDPVSSPFGDAISGDEWVYYLSVVIAAVGFVFAWSLLQSRTGRAFRAIRDSELAAKAFGVNLATYKTLAFALSAAYAGVAGSLLAIATAFVGPGGFDFPLSILLLVGVVVGGLGLIEGALWGAVFVEFLPIGAQQLLEPISRQLARAAPAITFGVALILIMFAARNGLAGLARQGYSSLQSRVERATARQASDSR